MHRPNNFQAVSSHNNNNKKEEKKSRRCRLCDQTTVFVKQWRTLYIIFIGSPVVETTVFWGATPDIELPPISTFTYRRQKFFLSFSFSLPVSSRVSQQQQIFSFFFPRCSFAERNSLVEQLLID
jgi:hypothetical protein